MESGDRRRPGQQDQEAKNPLAAKVAHEEVGEECRTEDDDRVREQREDDRVLERGAEVRVRPLRRVVVEADEVTAQRPRRCVRHREVDGEDQRRPDEQADEDHRGRDQCGREKAALLEEIPSSGAGTGRPTASTRNPYPDYSFPRMAEIALENVSKVYADGTRAVRDLDLEVEDGELMVFVGPSGCGKTSALRMIAGLEEISDGTIRIGDELVNDLPPKDRDVAMIFQNYALYPHMDTYANMAFALKMRGIGKPEIDRRVAMRRKVLGLEDVLTQETADALRRAAPAGGDGPRDRARAAGVPDGRAALQPRRQAPRADARRDRADPARAERDDDLRHARPVGGDDARRPRRRHAQGRAAAARHAAEPLQGTGQSLRRRVHRLAGDEPRRGRDRRRQGAVRRAHASGRRTAAGSPPTRDARSRSGFGPRTWRTPRSPTSRPTAGCR